MKIVRERSCWHSSTAAAAEFVSSDSFLRSVVADTKSAALTALAKHRKNARCRCWLRSLETSRLPSEASTRSARDALAASASISS